MARGLLVVSRAGAITAAEICAAGRAALLLPLELAAGHQDDNARALERAGAARVLLAAAATSSGLERELGALLADAPALAAHGTQGARPGATRGRGGDRGAGRQPHGERAVTGFRLFAGLSRVHFVGIGGAGMSGIAEVLLDYQVEVTGCDQAQGSETARLAELGARISLGHSADHLEGVELVVRLLGGRATRTRRSWRRANAAFRWSAAPRCWPS